MKKLPLWVKFAHHMVSVLNGVSSWRNAPVLEKIWFLFSFTGLDTAFSANLLFIIYINNNAPDPCSPARCLFLLSEIYLNLWFTSQVYKSG